LSTYGFKISWFQENQWLTLYNFFNLAPYPNTGTCLSVSYYIKIGTINFNALKYWF